MHPDLYVAEDGRTYTRPMSDLRSVEVRHMLNGFVTRVIRTTAPLDELMDTTVPAYLAAALVVNREALRMNYRIVKVGHGYMLFGRPVRKD